MSLIEDAPAVNAATLRITQDFEEAVVGLKSRDLVCLVLASGVFYTKRQTLLDDPEFPEEVKEIIRVPLDPTLAEISFWTIGFPDDGDVTVMASYLKPGPIKHAGQA